MQGNGDKIQKYAVPNLLGTAFLMFIGPVYERFLSEFLDVKTSKT